MLTDILLVVLIFSFWVLIYLANDISAEVRDINCKLEE